MQADDQWFPYGFFISWGGWLAEDIKGMDHTVGNLVHPVSPFEPGGHEAVETYLEESARLHVAWNFDLQHVYRNETALREQVPCPVFYLTIYADLGLLLGEDW